MAAAHLDSLAVILHILLLKQAGLLIELQGQETTSAALAHMTCFTALLMHQALDAAQDGMAQMHHKLLAFFMRP